MRACTALIVFNVLSNIANVVPTGALADISEACNSAEPANLRPSSTIEVSSAIRTCEGSLYGSGMMLSRMAPDGTSTSRNSPGAIGVSSPLTLRPRVLNPPGRFDNVPASTS